MAIGQTVANIWRFTDIFNMAAVCPPSGICYARLDHPQRAFYGRPMEYKGRPLYFHAVIYGRPME